MPPTITDIEAELWRRSIVDPTTNCRLWQGHTINGYGKITYKYKSESVHRLSAMLYLDYDLEDLILQINHKPECTNRNCWNPEHLYIGTQSENINDAYASGRAVPYNRLKTHCPRGHEYTKENTRIDSFNYRHCKICHRNEATRRREFIKMMGRLRNK